MIVAGNCWHLWMREHRFANRNRPFENYVWPKNDEYSFVGQIGASGTLDGN